MGSALKNAWSCPSPRVSFLPGHAPLFPWPSEKRSDVTGMCPGVKLCFVLTFLVEMRRVVATIPEKSQRSGWWWLGPKVSFHSWLEWQQKADGARGEGSLPVTLSSKALPSASKTRAVTEQQQPGRNQRTRFAEENPHLPWGWCKSVGEGTGSESQGQLL